jgi:hypothetical protein
MLSRDKIPKIKIPNSKGKNKFEKEKSEIPKGCEGRYLLTTFYFLLFTNY